MHVFSISKFPTIIKLADNYKNYKSKALILLLQLAFKLNLVYFHLICKIFLILIKVFWNFYWDNLALRIISLQIWEGFSAYSTYNSNWYLASAGIDVWMNKLIWFI